MANATPNVQDLFTPASSTSSAPQVSDLFTNSSAAPQSSAPAAGTPPVASTPAPAVAPATPTVTPATDTTTTPAVAPKASIFSGIGNALGKANNFVSTNMSAFNEAGGQALLHPIQTLSKIVNSVSTDATNTTDNLLSSAAQFKSDVLTPSTNRTTPEKVATTLNLLDSMAQFTFLPVGETYNIASQLPVLKPAADAVGVLFNTAGAITGYDSQSVLKDAVSSGLIKQSTADAIASSVKSVSTLAGQIVLGGYVYGLIEDGMSPKDAEVQAQSKADDLNHVTAWDKLGRPDTMDEAKANYRELAHSMHPDKAGGTTAKMSELNQAYDLLKSKGIPDSSLRKIAPSIAWHEEKGATPLALGNGVPDEETLARIAPVPDPTPVNSPDLNPPNETTDITTTGNKDINLSGKMPGMVTSESPKFSDIIKNPNVKPTPTAVEPKTPTLSEIVKNPKVVAPKEANIKPTETPKTSGIVKVPVQRVAKTPVVKTPSEGIIKPSTGFPEAKNNEELKKRAAELKKQRVGIIKSETTQKIVTIKDDEGNPHFALQTIDAKGKVSSVQTFSTRAEAQEEMKSNPRAGFVSASGAKQGIEENVTALKEALKENQRIGKQANNLDDTFRTQQNKNIADSMQLRETLRSSGITPEEETHIDEAYENGDMSKLTPKEKQAFDKYEPAFREEEARNIKILTGKDVPTDEYSPRFVTERDPLFRKITQGKEVSGGKGSLLKKTVGNTKNRVMWAAEDGKGTRKIISIKSGIITEWDNNEPTIIGKTKVPETVPVKEFYDKQVMEKLTQLAEDLGIDYQRVVKLRGTHAGESEVGTNKIRVRAATPEEVLLHEIGHQLDKEYGIGEGIVNSAKFSEELRALADKRFEGGAPNKSFTKYVRKSSEKVAVMFEAYLHAPELFKSTAPQVYDWFTHFLGEHDSTKPILDIKPSLVLGSNIVGEKLNVPKTFLDDEGKRWNIVQAKKSEIEANTDIKYSPYWLTNHLVAIQRLRAAVRAADIIEHLVSDPATKDLIVKLADEPLPNGWVISDSPQLRGYGMQPALADIINKYYTAGGDDGLLQLVKLGVYIRNVSLFNPIYHGMINVLPNFLKANGIDSFNPIKYPANAKGLSYAYRATINPFKSPGANLPSQIELLRNNMTLTSVHARGTLEDEIQNRIGHALQEQLNKDGWGEKLFGGINESLEGLGKMNPLMWVDKAIGKRGWSFEIAMKSEDLARQSIAYRSILKQTNGKGLTKDLTPEDRSAIIKRAVQRVDAVFPTNRISAGQLRALNGILGRRPTQILLNNIVTLFMQYHAGLFQNMFNDVKGATTGMPEGGTRSEALERIAAGIFILAALYPALDGLVKWILRNPTAAVKRGGDFAILNSIEQYLKGKDTFSQALTGTVTLQPLLVAAMETIENRDFFTGNQLAYAGDGSTPLSTFMGELGSNVVVSSNLDAIISGGKSPSTYLLSLIGLSTPKSSPSLINVDSLYYDQYNGDNAAMKKAVASGNVTQAEKIMKTYNDELLSNMVDAVIENQPVKGSPWYNAIQQIKIQDELIGGYKSDLAKYIWSQVQKDSKLKAQFLHLPTSTQMKTYAGNQSKSGLQKINL